jgi:CMP-N-acetylneuraminic acid synthetase
MGLHKQQEEEERRQKLRDREAAILQREADLAAQKAAKQQAKVKKAENFKEQQQLVGDCVSTSCMLTQHVDNTSSRPCSQ